ncbi:MAG: hypothetical protein GY822_17250 [Deltaproteobacteria bacterium]|nr:hypothetical protein [Deltaproteobacteria bacterium]
MTIDYEKLEYDARQRLQGPVDRVQGLIRVWTMFMAADEIAREFAEKVDELSPWAKHAMTVALTVEYAKPWSRNLELSLRDLDKSYLDSVVQDPRHSELRNYRNQGAAHLDDSVLPTGVCAQGTTMPNSRPMDGRYNELTFTARIRIEAVPALGLSRSEDISALHAQISEARRLTKNEVGIAARELHQAALESAPILSRLGDLLPIVAVQEDEPGQFQMPEAHEGHVPGMSREQSTLDIHLRQFSRLIVAWQTTLPNMDELDIIGDGFRLQTTARDDDRYSFNLQFGDIQINLTSEES